MLNEVSTTRSKFLELWAVQKCAKRVYLEKCWKIRIHLQNRPRYGGERDFHSFGVLNVPISNLNLSKLLQRASERTCALRRVQLGAKCLNLCGASPCVARLPDGLSPSEASPKMLSGRADLKELIFSRRSPPLVSSRLCKTYIIKCTHCGSWRNECSAYSSFALSAVRWFIIRRPNSGRNKQWLEIEQVPSSGRFRADFHDLSEASSHLKTNICN